MISPRTTCVFHFHRVRPQSKTASNRPLTLPEGGWRDGWRPAALATASVTVAARRAGGRAVCRTALEAHFHAIAFGSLSYVEGELLFLGSADGSPHAFLVVGIDEGVQVCPGDRDITQRSLTSWALRRESMLTMTRSTVAPWAACEVEA
jgi:hypothetical protein